MSYRIRLLETEEGWAVSCLDLPGCHSQGESRDEALENIREAIALWLEVEAEEAGVISVETLELALYCPGCQESARSRPCECSRSWVIALCGNQVT
jgi:predicted RNase H-like HicB family nuclease